MLVEGSSCFESRGHSRVVAEHPSGREWAEGGHRGGGPCQRAQRGLDAAQVGHALVQVVETGPRLWLLTPAAPHHLEDGIGAFCGLPQPPLVQHQLHDLVVRFVLEGQLPVGEELPDHHSEGPDVAHGGEAGAGDGLGGHPA